MYTYYKKTEKMKPIKIWLSDESKIEQGCLDQAKAVAQLPFVHKWLALMPDTHLGAGMPIGGVLATKGVIVPFAVGMDIGCGMCYIQTNISLESIKSVQVEKNSLLELMIQTLLKEIPVGKQCYQVKQESVVIDEAFRQYKQYKSFPDAEKILEGAYYQTGTLGGGNHFIELQVDEQGMIGIMLHSGSRHLGAVVCQHFQKLALELNQKWYSSLPENSRLAFLPTSSWEGQEYLKWMNLALDYAFENREAMLAKTMNIFADLVYQHVGTETEFSSKINCHHNYASLEHHYGENVWVHRKGATRARKNELGIIPGAMGSYSYLVRGLGNEESFHSSSHGAGRVYSRTKAKENFPSQEVLTDLKEQEVIIGKRNLADVAEESRFAYKNIDEVMENQKDLVHPIKKLKTIGVVKG
ncbi:RtcB family protein [Carnobacterium gallinarum]|uniref:RtcB family protein n=1 Tax=Carnobacterium gallinarum TaxID=2749 RepID=UPI0005502036|nr:RtcB family protein [Carnobacterium gallinarum]